MSTAEEHSAEDLVDSWLTLAQTAEILAIPVSKVRRLLEDRALAAVKRGKPKELQVPELFLADGEPLRSLRGTLITLYDSGFSIDEAISWLFTPDDSLPGRPIDQLRKGHKTEVRRRAQALAF